MRRLALGLLVMSTSACFHPTWAPLRPDTGLSPDTIVLAGSLRADPPIQQHGLPRGHCGVWYQGRWEPDGKIVFVQETDGNLMAMFTSDLSEPWKPQERKAVEPTAWTYLPVQGHFFIQVPRASRVQLRGLYYLTNAGARTFELPAHVDVSPQDRVVYVGEIQLQRSGARRAGFRDQVEGARAAARERGLTQLLQEPWTVRLLQTSGSGPSLGEEWGDSCDDGKAGWVRLSPKAK